MDNNKIKETIKKGIKLAVKPFIIIMLIVILVVSLFFGVVDQTFEAVSEIFNDVMDNIKISGNNIEIDQEYLQNAKEKLKRMGINSETLGLGNDEEYLERFLEAEIVTNYPYLGGDGLQGTVYFDRAKVDGTTTRLQYISYDEFYAKINNGEDVNDYFTVDEEDWTAHIMKIDGNIEKINYQNMVEKFAMPFEFPIALAMTSQNPQFALAVVNLVKDSRMVVTIAETRITTTTTVTEYYDQTITQTTLGSGENPGQTQTTSGGPGQGTPQVTTEVTYSTEIFLSSARTWILNYIIDYQRDESSQDMEPVETPLNPTTSTSTRPNGTVITTTHTNRRSVKNVNVKKEGWRKGSKKVEEKTERFTELIINDGATNGNGFVLIAKELHDYLAEYQYYYSSAANVEAGRYVQDGEAINSRRPTFGEPMSERYLCCTTFSAWVLETAGYEGIAYGSLELLNDSIKDRGWIVIDDLNDVEPGDICFWNDADGVFAHTNVCAAREADGTLLYYDTGSTDRIRAFDPIEYKESSRRKFAFAYRPNDEIAKALGAGSIDDLKDDIEEYIDTSVTEGEYSVSVMDLNANDRITINNERTKSNGLIKLFIMATAYNEVDAGRLDESAIVSDIERMIMTDSNDAANNLLTTMGDTDGTRDDQDIAKGVDKLNEYCRRNSYKDTKLEGKIEDSGNEQTYTTVEDVRKLLSSIFNGTCVNSNYSTKMLDIMKLQTITDMIPSTLTDAEVRNKTGEQSGIIQDSAIISTENANYIIVISAKDITNTENAKAIIREIANMVNLYFEKYGTIQDNTSNYEDDGIETRMNGDRVCYKLPSGQFQCPLNNLVEAREMLFELLGKFEKTQSHERLMRYLLYLLTGNDYGVTEFDFYEFLGEGFNNVSGLVGNSLEEKVWWALINVGYSKEATAGVMGNIYAESGFNAGAVEGGSGIGFGLCQWSFGRRTKLEAYAASKGVPPSDADTQIEFLLGELSPGGGANGYAAYALMPNHGYTVSDWKNASTPELAAEIFCWIFERPGIPRMDVRTEAARRYYEQFKDLEKPTYSGDDGNELQQQIANEARNNGNAYRHDKGYCEAWVELIYKNFGLSFSGACCASYAAQCWMVSSSQSGIPLGATVYGGAPAINWTCSGYGTHTPMNPGHVGIYIGNGDVCSNESGVITIRSVDSWASRYGWKGWGWTGGIDLTQQ